MQRVVGFIMIFAGCSGLGVWYGKQYREQIKTLRSFCRILEYFEAEIRFGRAVLSECCLKLADRTQEPFRSSFYDIYDKFYENSGESFGDICRESLENGLKNLVVKKEDKEVFINCFSSGGYEENLLQIRLIEQAREELADRLALAEQENASKYKLALGMGVMSGLLLIILLV